MLKNAYFLEKSVKFATASEAPPPEPPFASSDWCLGPRPQRFSSAYYYSFVEIISSAKCVLLPSKKDKITTINVLLLLHPHFYTLFLLQTL